MYFAAALTFWSVGPARGVSCPAPRSIPRGEWRNRVPDRLALCSCVAVSPPRDCFLPRDACRLWGVTEVGYYSVGSSWRGPCSSCRISAEAPCGEFVAAPRARKDFNWPTPSPTSSAPMTAKTTVMMVLFLCTSQVRAVWSGPVMRSGFTTNARVGAITERGTRSLCGQGRVRRSGPAGGLRRRW